MHRSWSYEQKKGKNSFVLRFQNAILSNNSPGVGRSTTRLDKEKEDHSQRRAPYLLFTVKAYIGVIDGNHAVWGSTVRQLLLSRAKVSNKLYLNTIQVLQLNLRRKYLYAARMWELRREPLALMVLSITAMLAAGASGSCADLTSCGACRNTTFCHWCSDQKCHAIGSIHG